MFDIWYRHTAQPPIDCIPSMLSTELKRVTEKDIKADIKNHYITHLRVDYKVPVFAVVAPQLTHLEIRRLKDLSALDRYVSYYTFVTI